LVLGVGGNNTAELVEQLKKDDLTDFSAILSVSPYYNKPSQEGIYQHYKAISKASPLPIILYNVPGRTASNIAWDTTIRLANEFKNIIAIKEASGNIEQCMKIIKYRPDNFLIISGDDNLTLPLIASGADGVISVVANAYPKDFSEMVRSALVHDLKTAQKLHYKLMEITEQLFADGNPGGVKVVLAQKKITGTHVRLPLVEPNDAVKAKLKKIAY
jgi:4-hydroxy-tetrahydrodipicolinate synthase